MQIKFLLNEEQLSDLLFQKSIDLGIKSRDIKAEIGLLDRIGIQQIIDIIVKRYPEYKKQLKI